jgi:hypothetical protein
MSLKIFFLKKSFIHKYNTWCQKVILCNHLSNWSKKTQTWGIFLASLKTIDLFHILSQDNLYSMETQEYMSIWSFSVSISNFEFMS